MPLTDNVLMVRPAGFGYNAETANTNHFQHPSNLSSQDLQELVAKEFNNMVSILRGHGINVMVVNDTPEPVKPDAIFPNNWLCTHPNGIVSVFPMQALSRRAEKRSDIIEFLSQQFSISGVEDWSDYEKEEQFLEGTGSMVIDHEHKIIYACLSPRTHLTVLEKFAELHGYRAMSFSAHDEDGNAIYHTNVMLCIGEQFAVLCPKAITDHDERVAVAQLLEATGHENIYISHDQLKAFAGNMLQLKNGAGEKIIVLSLTAFDSLENEKKQRLEQYGRLLPIDVSAIEKVEGGSVRCMMAEVYLPAKPK